MPTQVRSHAKINLGLAIGPARADGFHGLVTVYQTLALHDVVSVSARRLPAGSASAIRLTTNDRRVPTDASNTAWRIVERALAALGVSAEVGIHIEKNLPVQGGLGAGSANAAAALIALEHELKAKLPGDERLAVAAAVGSDVPLFLVGGSVLGLGRGEEVYPLPDLPAAWCVVAAPAVGVSTPQAFRDWDARQAASEALTAAAGSDRLIRLSRSLAAVFSEPCFSGVFSEGEGLAGNPLLALVRTGIENDFEQVVFPLHPFLGEIKRTLAASSGTEVPENAALYAALSGSGSALFGLYATERAARAACQRLSALGVPAFLTKTAPRAEYWRGMIVEPAGLD